MMTNDPPTGLLYLTTYQAIFQIIELAVYLAIWIMLATQLYINPVLYAPFGTTLFTWLVTLFFFIIYITGLQAQLNNNYVVQGESSSQTNEKTCCNSVSTWLIIEYIVYVLLLILHLSAAIVITIFIYNGVLIAAAVLAWFGFVIYLVQFVLLIITNENLWSQETANQCCFCCQCCCPDQSADTSYDVNSEMQSLLDKN